MKKFTLFLAALCFTVMANAWNLQVDGICYNVNWSDETATVTYESKVAADNYKNLSGRVVIPATVRGDLTNFKVVAIGDSAFRYNKAITTIDLRDAAITTIGKSAFEYMNVYDIYLSSTLTTLGRDAMLYCTNLTQITLPENLQTIGVECFHGCKALTSIRIPDKVETIDFGAFRYCDALTSVVLPSSCPYIGDHCFAHDYALSLIFNYAETPQSIYASAFSGISVPEVITLRVPYGSGPAYRAAEGWKMLNIEELPDPNEGIDEVSQQPKANSQKLIKNGQLIIERNGKTYNALGTGLK